MVKKLNWELQNDMGIDPSEGGPIHMTYSATSGGGSGRHTVMISGHGGSEEEGIPPKYTVEGHSWHRGFHNERFKKTVPPVLNSHQFETTDRDRAMAAFEAMRNRVDRTLSPSAPVPLVSRRVRGSRSTSHFIPGLSGTYVPSDRPDNDQS